MQRPPRCRREANLDKVSEKLVEPAGASGSLELVVSAVYVELGATANRLFGQHQCAVFPDFFKVGGLTPAVRKRKVDKF